MNLHGSIPLVEKPTDLIIRDKYENVEISSLHETPKELEFFLQWSEMVKGCGEKRKWAHKIRSLQEPPTRNIPCFNV